LFFSPPQWQQFFRLAVGPFCFFSFHVSTTVGKTGPTSLDLTCTITFHMLFLFPCFFLPPMFVFVWGLPPVDPFPNRNWVESSSASDAFFFSLSCDPIFPFRGAARPERLTNLFFQLDPSFRRMSTIVFPTSGRLFVLVSTKCGLPTSRRFCPLEMVRFPFYSTLCSVCPCCLPLAEVSGCVFCFFARLICRYVPCFLPLPQPSTHRLRARLFRPVSSCGPPRG